MSFTRSQAALTAGWDSTCRDKLLALDGVGETVTSGTISLLTPVTYISVTGTTTFTLPDAAAADIGLRKRLKCSVAASIPAGTLTITSPETTAGIVCPATFVFDTVGQEIWLVWSGTKWQVEKTVRAGVKIATVGTTVLTGFNLCHNLSLSVTGTVSSTTTMGVPNGTYPGDFLIVSQSTAASIPVGNITGTFLTLANAAATDLQAWGATTDTVTLTWNGSKWLIIANSGVTVA
jgi:hypothetical protein